MTPEGDTHAGSQPLRLLAADVGILAGYEDQTGREWRETSDETRRLILAAMGLDAASDDAAARTQAQRRPGSTDRVVLPVRVVKQADPARGRLRVSLPAPQRDPIRWEATLILEDGAQHDMQGEEPAGAGHGFTITLPIDPPLGYHTVRVAVNLAGARYAAEQLLVVVPASCVRAEELLGGQRSWGLVANLYSIRSDRNWGIGDATDLAEVATWAAGLGAQFVGVNPLHAILNRTGDVSPYSPVTRLFRNPAYIDVEAIPELEHAPGAMQRLRSQAFQQELASLRAAVTIDYARVMAAKWPMLRACFDAAVVRPEGERWRQYRDWCAMQEPLLTGFARHMAREVGGFRLESTPRFDDPDAMDVELHRWVQWELERQLGVAARRAADAGMRIGLYQDLAIGSASSGSDAETFRELFVSGVSVGAPPDPYSAHGQNWGFPPLDPNRLAADRYRYFIALVRAGLRNAGALRIDHVMGLFRLFWIPDGYLGEDGAYVRYPSEDLLGILALESVRHRALVVGEDLGTVPEDVPPALERWGILSSKVLYFERGEHGTFRPPREYAANSLATANTHDMATLLGFLAHRDVALRVEHGLVRPGGGEVAHAERARDVEQLLDMLVREGHLEPGQRGNPTAFRAAVHDMLAASPAWLVGVSLDDVAGEVEAVNLPGVGPEAYPAWQRRMTKSLETLRGDPEALAAIGTRLLEGRERC